MSEFGKGLCYCIGLFLAHVEILPQTLKLYEEMRKKNPDLDALLVTYYGRSPKTIKGQVVHNRLIEARNAKVREAMKVLRVLSADSGSPPLAKPRESVIQSTIPSLEMTSLIALADSLRLGACRR